MLGCCVFNALVRGQTSVVYWRKVLLLTLYGIIQLQLQCLQVWCWLCLDIKGGCQSQGNWQNRLYLPHTTTPSCKTSSSKALPHSPTLNPSSYVGSSFTVIPRSFSGSPDPPRKAENYVSEFPQFYTDLGRAHHELHPWLEIDNRLS